jgi:hypothetical protein
VEFYRLEPTRLVLIDNCRGFGHKETLELGENPTNNREASNPSISADPLVTPTRHANFHDLT